MRVSLHQFKYILLSYYKIIKSFYQVQTYLVLKSNKGRLEFGQTTFIHNLHIKIQYKFQRMKLMSSLFKDDPLQKQLKKIGLITDSLTSEVIMATLHIFKQKTLKNQEQSFLKVMLKHLEQKTSHARKLKIMSCLIEISKISKYDFCDIILNKKIKTFTKPTKFKFNEIEPKPEKLQEFILQELLIPEYNYIMKLGTNQQLYQTCKQGEIPYDQIFRRGTKIRFIWIFKLYNIINALIPILKSLIKAQKLNNNLLFLQESISFLFNDLSIMNNFVIKALEQASTDNFMLMPYFDMLQFHESLKEQIQVGKNVIEIYSQAKKYSKSLIQPLRLSLKQQEIEQIEIQALRVKLISDSLKNPKKDHKILQTEYNEKVQKKYSKNIPTEPNNTYEKQTMKPFDKWKCLD